MIEPPSTKEPMSIEFNVQTFLSEMRKELREDHRLLVSRVDDGFAEVTATARAVRDELVNHTSEDYRTAQALDIRLQPIESALKNVKWMTRTIVAAAILGAIDLLFHWKTP